MEPINKQVPAPVEEAPPPSTRFKGSGFNLFLATLNKEVPGLLALIMVITYCASILFGISVDDKFLWAISVILSFYFGSKRGGE